MFNTFGQKPQVKESNEGCKIKIKYDKTGRIKGIESNGKCSRAETELFKQNLGLKESDQDDDL